MGQNVSEKTGKLTIEVQLVRETEVCGKVYGEENG